MLFMWFMHDPSLAVGAHSTTSLWLLFVGSCDQTPDEGSRNVCSFDPTCISDLFSPGFSSRWAGWFVALHYVHHGVQRPRKEWKKQETGIPQMMSYLWLSWKLQTRGHLWIWKLSSTLCPRLVSQEDTNLCFSASAGSMLTPSWLLRARGLYAFPREGEPRGEYWNERERTVTTLGRGFNLSSLSKYMFTYRWKYDSEYIYSQCT